MTNRAIQLDKRRGEADRQAIAKKTTTVDARALTFNPARADAKRS